MVEMIRSRASKTLFRMHVQRWQIVMNSLFMSILRLMNTSYTEIQLHIIYWRTQLGINLDNDRKKDATVPDWNAVSKMNNLPPLIRYVEIFLQKQRMILYCNTQVALNRTELFNHPVFSSFGASRMSWDKEASKMTMRIFLVLIYSVLVECISHTRMRVSKLPQRVIHEHKTASQETHLAQTDSHTFADHCHIWDRWPFRINDAYLCNASKVSDSHRINHQSQYQLYCPESECHQQGITNGIHVDILGYCIDLHVTTTLEHVID